MNRVRVSGTAAGCLYLIGIAVTTSAMLFVNGSIVFIFIRAMTQAGSALGSREDVAQFLLLAIPVLMVVVQWKMIDYVWSRIHKAG